MAKSNKTKEIEISIGGMSCVSCQNKINKKLSSLNGVKKATVSYTDNKAKITYNESKLSFDSIKETIEKLGYTVETNKNSPFRSVGILVIIFATYLLLETTGLLNMLSPKVLADSSMNYGMLFIIGLMTSVHCIAMCGGINLSQSMGRKENTILYNFGRVIAYTIVGFIVGAIGSVITFSNSTQGALKILAGVFMVIMGINMIGIFPWLRKLNPRMPKFISRKINVAKFKSKSPLYVGLLNGLMPCGPLQSMQIYALSTGSAIAGATSMLLFSLGTLPLMLGFGMLSSLMSVKIGKKIMTVGATLVVVLGLSMFTQGYYLTQFETFEPVATNTEKSDDVTYVLASRPGSGGLFYVEVKKPLEMSGETQVITSDLSNRSYPEITVKVGAPVKWVINADASQINGCNNRFFIPEYGIEHTLTPGENVIEFEPTRTGNFTYSCWMGMIRSTITVEG